ncbi:hypothetical protein D3C81_986930 [compost metagenome]
MMGIRVTPLDKSEIQVFLAILLERAKWLESIGQPMWSIENLDPVNFEKMYPNYKPYLIYENDNIIGGFVLLEHDDFL